MQMLEKSLKSRSLNCQEMLTLLITLSEKKMKKIILKKRNNNTYSIKMFQERQLRLDPIRPMVFRGSFLLQK